MERASGPPKSFAPAPATAPLAALAPPPPTPATSSTADAGGPTNATSSEELARMLARVPDHVPEPLHVQENVPGADVMSLEQAARMAMANLQDIIHPADAPTQPARGSMAVAPAGPPQSSGIIGAGGKPVNESDYRLFVSKVPPSLSKEDLKTYFGTFGALTDVYIPGDGHKGICFVSYVEHPGMQAALAVPAHIVNGEIISVEFAAPRAPPPQTLTASISNGSRLFLTKITPDITRSDLQSYFSGFGELVDCYVPPGNKGIAFVSYKEPSAAQTVLQNPWHNVKPNQAINVTQAFDRPGKGKGKSKDGNIPGPPQIVNPPGADSSFNNGVNPPMPNQMGCGGNNQMGCGGCNQMGCGGNNNHMGCGGCNQMGCSGNNQMGCGGCNQMGCSGGNNQMGCGGNNQIGCNGGNQMGCGGCNQMGCGGCNQMGCGGCNQMGCGGCSQMGCGGCNNQGGCGGSFGGGGGCNQAGCGGNAMGNGCGFQNNNGCGQGMAGGQMMAGNFMGGQQNQFGMQQNQQQFGMQQNQQFGMQQNQQFGMQNNQFEMQRSQQQPNQFGMQQNQYGMPQQQQGQNMQSNQFQPQQPLPPPQLPPPQSPPAMDMPQHLSFFGGNALPGANRAAPY